MLQSMTSSSLPPGMTGGICWKVADSKKYHHATEWQTRLFAEVTHHLINDFDVTQVCHADFIPDDEFRFSEEF